MCYKRCQMRDKRFRKILYFWRSCFVAVASFLFIGCRQEPEIILQTVGVLNICNKTGTDIVVQTNINENPLLPGLACLIEADNNFWVTIAESDPLQGELNDVPWEKWDGNIAEVWVKIYTYNEQEDRALTKVWTYANRSQLERQLFDKDELEKRDDSFNGTKYIEYRFAILPEDIE